ncbi:hypothetical protein BF49_4369 [Bradyrhizobium sp.]|nr:hypothetical protein BF49_4369 [Bradyrhizobium sp.]
MTRSRADITSGSNHAKNNARGGPYKYGSFYDLRRAYESRMLAT